VTPEDLKAVAAMALRLRRSQFMSEYLRNQRGEEKELSSLLGNFGTKNGSRTRAARTKRTSKKK
jgi:hypothetical protein